MKSFKDIVFKPHPAGEGLHGLLFFPNGYGVSVVRFKINGRHMSYTNNDNQWELAVIFGDEKEWDITYNTPITNNVMGHLSSDEVTKIMEKIQKL
jgi:hypothetical protein